MGDFQIWDDDERASERLEFKKLILYALTSLWKARALINQGNLLERSYSVSFYKDALQALENLIFPYVDKYYVAEIENEKSIKFKTREDIVDGLGAKKIYESKVADAVNREFITYWISKYRIRDRALMNLLRRLNLLFEVDAPPEETFVPFIEPADRMKKSKKKK